MTFSYPTYPTIKHLIESHDDLDAVARDALDEVHRQCQPWIEAIGGKDNLATHTLYRGTNRGVKGDWTTHTIRDNRLPLGMSQQNQATWNDLIEAAGKKANRSNAIICTSRRSHASTFAELSEGQVYAVFPIGEFHYTWMEQVIDLNDLVSLAPWNADQHEQHEQYVDDHELSLLNAGEREWVTNHSFPLDLIRGDDGSIIEAIRTGVEIMISPVGQRVLLVDPGLVNIWSSIQ